MQVMALQVFISFNLLLPCLVQSLTFWLPYPKEPLDYRIYDKCLERRLDLYFLLDSSNSIYIEEYRRGVEFVRHVVSRLDISERTTNIVGALSFSRHVQNNPLRLDKLIDKKRLINYITEKELPYLAHTPITNVLEALEYVGNSNNVKFRQNAVKIIVVITDGESHDPVLSAGRAEQLKLQGYYIAVVIIGHYQQMKELRTLASDPDKDFLFDISFSQSLLPVVTTFLEKVCLLSNTIVNIFTRCVDKRMDLYFLLDSSNTINSDNYLRVLEFIRSLVSQSDIRPEATRVIGALSFGQNVQTKPAPLILHDLTKKVDILSYITSDNLPYLKGRIAATDEALKYVRTSGIKYFRKDALKVILIFTGGNPNDHVRADLLWTQGFYIYVIGVGQRWDRYQWSSIAIDPHEFIFSIEDTHLPLQPVVSSLLTKVCSLTVVDTTGCKVGQFADLIFVAGQGGVTRAYQLINQFALDFDGLLQVSYVFDHCKRNSLFFDRVENHCGSYTETKCSQYPEILDKYTNLLLVARRCARKSRRAQRPQVAVLFIDEESFLINWYEIKNLIDDGIQVIVVDLGVRHCYTDFLRSIPEKVDNYIRIDTTDVFADMKLYYQLLSRICNAVNGANYTDHLYIK